MGDLHIDGAHFNQPSYLDQRLQLATAEDKGALRTALAYLYADDGPINLPRQRLQVAKKYLEPAELIVIAWLYTRTNGSLRKKYGAAALQAARKSRYRCENCSVADVRVLNLDHVNGRDDTAMFACLCANCHAIKSRASDWLGIKRETVI